MSKDEKKEPSFPEPFEPFNQDTDMAANIEQLRLAEQTLEKLNKGLEQAQRNIKDKSPDYADYNNLAITERYYRVEIQKLNSEIPTLRAKTYGVFERFFKENKVEPELANQVMQVLDEKVYPEKYENRTLEEDRQISHQAIAVEPEEGKSEIAKHLPESLEKTENAITPDKAPKDNNYSLSLFLRKKEEQAKLHSGIEVKDAGIDKNVMQNSGYLNYQLKLQKAVFKESPSEKKRRDFQKNNKDISPDKD